MKKTEKHRGRGGSKPGSGMAPAPDTRLRAKRLEAGLTMQEVADRAGVKRGVIQVWEAGTHVPRTDQVMPVAEAMGLDMEDLFHDFGIRRVPRTAKKEANIA